VLFVLWHQLGSLHIFNNTRGAHEGKGEGTREKELTRKGIDLFQIKYSTTEDRAASNGKARTEGEKYNHVL